jgi:hypothetical protein
MITITGPDALPKTLEEGEFSEYITIAKDLNRERLLRQAYAKLDEGTTYELVLPESESDRVRLWEIHAAANRVKWGNYAVAYLVAYYIYDHRLKVERKGDQDDDYRKAEYLVSLVNYLDKRPFSRVIRLRKDAAMEEFIDEVNNIFDSAYFRKLNHPGLPDSDCFLEAEREFCEEKATDFLVYQLQLNDQGAAEKRHAEREIEALAYQYYEWRQTTGEPGDEKSDWTVAEAQYPRWKITRRIATICWNLSTDKHKHPDHYWSRACEVMGRLENLGVPAVTVNPHDPKIYEMIVAAVADDKEPCK